MNKSRAAAFLIIMAVTVFYLSSPVKADEVPVFPRAPAFAPAPYNDALTEDVTPGPETLPVETGPVSEEDLDDAGLMNLAVSFSERGDMDEAASTYRLLLERFPASKLKFDAYYELGLLMYRQGRLDEARKSLKKVVSGWWIKQGLREKARLLLREIDSIHERGAETRTAAITIGALLPLKGPYARYGEASLKGILLAADVFGSMRHTPVKVVVRDVGTEPAGARQASREITANSDVLGLVGPLLSATAYESVVIAQARGVPVITLSRKEGLTGAGDYIFRNSLTPSQQAAAIADYSYNILGKRRFAVLYPDNYYGSAMAKSFAEEVLTLGGEVTLLKPYDRKNTDFSRELEDIFKIEINETTEGRRTIKEYVPTADVDALYIPDNYRTVSLIVPYLKYFNIEDVQLLGSNGWDSEELVRLGGAGVEGAVFVDGFFPAGARAGTSRFTDNFRKAYGRTPSVIEAEAYDAASMMISAIFEGGGDRPDRQTLKERLFEMKDFTGASGAISFDKWGESVKKPFILTVKRGRIVEAPSDPVDVPPAQ